MKKITTLAFALITGFCMLQAQTDWHITGNAGTSASTNFIGTTDNVPLKIRTNNAVQMTINSSGNVGIGTTKPKSKLDVAGTIGFDSYFGKTYPVSAGTSGASYSSVGYGLTFTNTTAIYHYRIDNDYSSMLSFRSGGFDFNTAPIGIAGSVISYTTAMAILQNGNVGIGTSSPLYKLHVFLATPNTTPAALIQHLGGNDGLYIKAGDNTPIGSRFILFENRDNQPLGSIEQNTSSSVSYNTTSDKRLKNIIGISQKGLPDLMKIKIYDYSFKSDRAKTVQTGFMAQELYEIFPQAVSKPRDNNEPAEINPWMVDYGRVTPLIIRSVQEQQQMIDELKKSNQDLKVQNESFQNQINELKAMIVSNQSTINTQLSSASLQQNIPNPFNHTTTINYTLPQRYSSAKIIVSDKSGKVLKQINLSGSKGSANIDASTLDSGAYQYSLYIDGKLIDTKQMEHLK